MSETEPYTESDVIEAFVALTETVAAYLDIFEIKDAKPETLARLHKTALGDLRTAQAKAEDIIAWISAEPDDEIDDAALDESLGLGDEDDDDDWDDDDEEEEDDEEAER